MWKDHAPFDPAENLPPPPPPLSITAVLTTKHFAVVGDRGDGGADAVLPVASPIELAFEPHSPGHANPLEPCAAADLCVTLIGSGTLAVDGAGVAVGERVKLRPGAVLDVDGVQFVVWRNAHAHA